MSNLALQPKEAPTVEGHRILGLMREFQAAPLGEMDRLFRQYGDAVRIHFMGPFYGLILAGPHHYKHILQDNQRNYDKKTPSMVPLRPVLGNGLLLSEGDFWLRQRRLAQPAFHRRRLIEFAETMVDATEMMLANWDRRPPGALLDTEDEMTALTFEIVGKTMFGQDLRGEAARVGEATVEVSRLVAELTTRVAAPITLQLPFWPSTRRLRHSTAILEEVVNAIIAERRAKPGAGDDLLSMFMSAEDEETGARMDDRQLRDEVLTMMLAGHETTSNTLVWTFYLLGRHPEIRDRLYAEIDAVLGGRRATFDDLRALPYTNQVLQESMRLYPAAYAISRRSIDDDVIEGMPVAGNTPITLSTYNLHRHPTYWPDPDTFDPDRFAPDAVKARPRFAYMPFGAGPRMCIGAQFAMTEATLILATIAQRYRLEILPGPATAIEPMITLRPKGGMPMRPHRRGSATGLD